MAIKLRMLNNTNGTAHTTVVLCILTDMATG